MQEMSIRDARGNCQCPWCGKYRKRSDFEEQPGHVDFGSETVSGLIPLTAHSGVTFRVHAHVAPACRFCLEAK